MQRTSLTFVFMAAVIVSTVFSTISLTVAEEAEDVVVTSSRRRVTIFDSPEFVSVITYEDIMRRSPAQTPDLLQWQAGILVQKTNLGGGSPFIRGLTGKHVLLMVDGIRMNNSLYRFGPHQYLNTLDPSIIERIEVVRGPMSVMYGSDALGGVINVITREREEFDDPFDLGGIAGFQYGSAARHTITRVTIEGNKNRIGFIGGVTYRDFDDLVGGRHVGLQEPTAYQEFDTDLKLNYKWGARHELILAQQLVRQYDVPKTSEVTLGNSLQYNYEPQIRYLTYLSYRSKNTWEPWITAFDVTLSYHNQLEGEVVIKRSTPNVETRELNQAQTFGSNLHLTSKPTSWQTIDTGVDFYYDFILSEKERITPTGTTLLTDPFPNEAWYYSMGIYLQDEFRVVDRVFLTLGERYNLVESEGEVQNLTTGVTDTLSLSVDDFTGAANLGVLITDWLKVVGGVAQGFRAPNMEDFFGKIDFSSEIPNTNLKSEKSINYEVGLKLWSKRIRGNIFCFYSEYEDLISRQTVGFVDSNGNGIQDAGEPDVIQRMNIGEAVIEGIEADLWIKLSDYLFVNGTAAYTRGEDTENNEPMRRIPPFTGSLELRYQLKRYWAAIEMIGASKQDRLSQDDINDPRIPEGGTPAYAVINLGGGVKFKNGLEFVLHIENLMDATYKPHGSGIYYPGTQAIITARWRF